MKRPEMTGTGGAHDGILFNRNCFRYNPYSMVTGIVFSSLIGYLLGSLSPAYFLGRIVLGIDVRRTGDYNAGTRNVYLLLGPWAAALTALIDLGKGIAAVLIARYAFRIPEPWVLLPGYAAVIGHIFPFYLGFRGGRGLTTATGLYLFGCGISIYRGGFSPGALLAVLAVALLIFAASRNGDLTGLVSSAFLSVITPLELELSPPSLGLLALSLFLFAMSTWGCVRNRVFAINANRETKWWRIIARPFALLFIPIDLVFHRTTLLVLLGALALIFGGTDIFRILTKYQLQQLFKKSEVKRFSSMTSFLVAIFLIFLVFPDFIPYLGLSFITIGDMFSKIIGIRFGKRVLLKDRTLEGTLGFVAGGFLSGWVLYSALPIPLYTVLAGPVFAAGVELFSGSLDDNFTVGILSSGFLYAVKYFLKV